VAVEPAAEPTSDAHRTRRVLRVAAVFVLLEVGLALLAHFSPVFVSLVRWAYVAVAIAFLFAVWRASRPRTGMDRRHADRRGD
jgi:uncharacterized membrane protein YccC